MPRGLQRGELEPAVSRSIETPGGRIEAWIMRRMENVPECVRMAEGSSNQKETD